MEAVILKKTNEYLLIQWSKSGVGFGQLEMIWNQEKGEFELDSELMDINHVIEVFKALKTYNYKNNIG